MPTKAPDSGAFVFLALLDGQLLENK